MQGGEKESLSRTFVTNERTAPAHSGGGRIRFRLGGHHPSGERPVETGKWRWGRDEPDLRADICQHGSGSIGEVWPFGEMRLRRGYMGRIERPGGGPSGLWVNLRCREERPPYGLLLLSNGTRSLRVFRSGLRPLYPRDESRSTIPVCTI